MIRKKFGNKQTSFSERVLKIALSIPSGKVMTYGGIARKAGGGPMASQSITSILGKAYETEKRIFRSIASCMQMGECGLMTHIVRSE